MFFPSKPAFVHYGTWSDESRAHPAMKWMEQYAYAFDSKSPDEIKKNLMTSDHLLVRTTGQKYTNATDSVNALYNEIYAPFAKWKHVPTHMICYEVDDGWEMMGFATVYWTLAGGGKQEGSGEKVKDDEGNEWDGANPRGFNFSYRKEGGGIRMAKTELAADPTVAVVGMLKRGLMKPEDLMK